MTSKSYAFILVIISLFLSTNISVAAVQLDEKFLKSTTGNSSVYLPVERLIEVIKNVKLNDGNHPKIVGWHRKGNVYTFTFIASTKIALKFEHLINQGGEWSSISAQEDGKPINPLSLIMQIMSMPRDKTKFDIADENNEVKRQKQESIIRAEEKKKQDEREAILKEARDEESLTNFKESVEKAFKAPELAFTTERDNEYLYYCNSNANIFKELSDKVSANDAQAMYDLGMQYKKIRSHFSDAGQLAAKWFLAAATLHDHPAALYEAANMLKNGESSVGLKENKELSSELMEKSASLGYAKAQTQMAIYYSDYYNKDKNKIKLYQEWLLKAAKQKEPRSLYMLGSDYARGNNGFKENIKEGIKLLKYCASLETETLYRTDNDAFEINSLVVRLAKDELERILGR